MGDALERLREMPAHQARACITSPPYFWQRDYDVEGQYGLESTPSEFVSRMVDVFEQVRRILTDDGTLWLNLGDSYNNRTVARPSSHQGGFGHDNESIRTSWADHARNGRARLSMRVDGLKEKDVIGIPWLVAFALRSAGWYLRAEVIWHKQYGKPESAGDRPSLGHETIFLLSKSKRYFYSKLLPVAARTVWTIRPSNDPDDGSASFPDELAFRCILSSTEPGDLVLDPFAGRGKVGMVAIRHDRRFVGIELNPETARLGQDRLLNELMEKVGTR